MAMSIKSIVRLSLCCAALAVVVACSPRRIPPLTVSDLMEDRVKLDGVLMKCNDHAQQARDASDCENARIAVERLEAQKQQQDGLEQKRAEEFERNREQLRQQADRIRQEQESKKPKLDAYHLPVVPVDPTPPPKDPQSPTVGQTTNP